MRKQYMPAIILIAIGALLLLYQMDLFYFSKSDFISYGMIIIGIIFLVNSFNRTDRKGIFGGVFFTVFGGSMLLMREYVFPRDDEIGFAAFFVALALANFAYLPFKKEKSTNFVWGIIFGVIGGLLLWTYFGYYPSWYMYDMIETYWPLVLILIGSVMIYKAYARKRESAQVETEV